jgi:hypothetical protein
VPHAGHHELPLPISFAVSGHVPDTDVFFIDAKAGVIKSVARLETNQPEDCVMVEELWYAHNQHKNVLVHSVRIDNPSADSVTVRLDHGDATRSDDITGKFRSLKNGTVLDKGISVLVGPVGKSKPFGTASVTEEGTAVAGAASSHVTGIVLHSTVPETLLVLPRKDIHKQTLVIAATVATEFEDGADYASAPCLKPTASPGDGETPKRPAECAVRDVLFQLIDLHRKAVTSGRLLKSHETSWGKVLPINLNFAKIGEWGDDRPWTLPAQVWATMYYVLAGAEEAKASKEAKLGEECYNGKPLRNEFDLWHESPTDRTMVMSLVDKWIALLTSSECIVATGSRHTEVSRASLMEAIAYAIVGVHVSTKSQSLTVHPSWNLNSGESIEIGPLKFDDHQVRLKLSRYKMDVTRLDHLSEPVLALETVGPTRMIKELETMTFPAGVLYLSHDEQNLHEHRHSDVDEHVPPPGYIGDLASKMNGGTKWSGPVITLLVVGVVVFHCLLFYVLFRESSKEARKDSSTVGGEFTMVERAASAASSAAKSVASRFTNANMGNKLQRKDSTSAYESLRTVVTSNSGESTHMTGRLRGKEGVA